MNFGPLSISVHHKWKWGRGPSPPGMEDTLEQLRLMLSRMERKVYRDAPGGLPLPDNQPELAHNVPRNPWDTV